MVMRAMVVFQNSGSALPEDRFVNTWHFVTNDPKDVAAPKIAARLAAFYNAGPNQFLSSKVDRGTNKSEVRVYDLDDPIPREPDVQTWTLSAAPSPSGPLPNEVAVCLSFYSGRNLPRSRGRIYLGPLDVNCMASGGADQRFSASFSNTLATAVEQLDNDSSLLWVVFSRADNDWGQVTNGWIDNAFDTQRRRGADADARKLFDMTTVVG